MAESPLQSGFQQRELERLYVEHHRWLYHWLCKKISCSQQAADFMQDTFCRLFRLDDLTLIKEPRAFLTTTATRIVLNDVRRKKVEKHYIEAYLHFDAEAAVSPSLEDRAIALQTLTSIVEMLEGLSPKCQKAFLLFRLDGMRQANIAAEMGISTSMVKKYIAQAMLHCYRVMNQD